DVGRQVRVLQPTTTDVDADLQCLRGGKLDLPMAPGGAGLSEDPALEGPDQAGLVGQSDEVARRQQTSTWMIPAHQRLESEQDAVLEPNRRLVVQDELPPLDGTRQVGFKLHPITD